MPKPPEKTIARFIELSVQECPKTADQITKELNESDWIEGTRWKHEVAALAGKLVKRGIIGSRHIGKNRRTGKPIRYFTRKQVPDENL